MSSKEEIDAATQAMLRYTNAGTSPGAYDRTRQLAIVALEAAEKASQRSILMHRCAGRRIENAKRAFELRFGKSMMPLSATKFRLDDGRECVKILDPETGTWAEYTICTKRIRRLREHDNAA